MKVKKTNNLLFRNSEGKTVSLDEQLTIGELTKMGITVRLQIIDAPLEKGWYGEVLPSETNWEFNVRYGRAIKALRKQWHLAKIPGINRKQLEDIEKGKRMVTSEEIKLLAQAHVLEPNRYLNKIARLLKKRKTNNLTI